MVNNRFKRIIGSIIEFDEFLIRYKVYQVVVAIFVAICFVLSFGSFFTNHLYKNYAEDSSNYADAIFIIRSSKYTQSFEANGSSLDAIRLSYDSDRSTLRTTDRVKVTLTDSSGITVCESSAYLYGSGRSYINIDVLASKLVVGDTYYLHFSFDEMSNQSLLVLNAHRFSDYSSLMVLDADELNLNSESTIIEHEVVSDNSIGFAKVANTGYLYSSLNLVRLATHFILYSAIVIILFFDRLTKSKLFKDLYSVIAVPNVLYVASEVLNVEKDSPLNILNPLSVKHYFCLLLTLLVFVLFELFFSSVTGYKSIGLFLTIVAIGVLSFVNHTKLVMRGDTLMPWDVAVAGIAMKTGSTYYFSITSRFISGVLLFLTLLIMIRLTHTPYKKLNNNRIIYILASVGLSVATANFCIFNTALLDRLNIYYEVYPPFQSYNENGTTLAFLLHLNNMGKADNYILESDSTDSLIMQYSEMTNEDTYVNRVNSSDIKPNVICIMSEAFTDLSDIRMFNTSEEVLPYYNSLKNESIYGDLAVSIFGGGTCNTEFEFLTGYSMSSLMPGASAYSFYVNDEIDALPRIYEQNGYRTVALHPFDGNWWDRASRYPLLGFNEFYTQNDFDSSASYVRRYISDYSCFNMITDIFDSSDDPLFLFCVTMQNHADFSEHYSNMSYDITIDDFTNELGEHYVYAENYISLLRESDDALAYLIEYLRQSDEPTIVVLFGDHCPTLNDGFYAELLQTDVGTVSLSESLELYQTKYFIWSNYDLGEGGTSIPVIPNYYGITSPNFLGQTVLDLSGIESPYNRSALRVLQNYVGAISAASVYDLDGEAYNDDYQLPDEVREIYDDYLTIQNNRIFSESDDS